MRRQRWVWIIGLLSAALAACSQFGPAVVPTATLTYLPTPPPSATPEPDLQLTYLTDPESQGSRLFVATLGCLGAEQPCLSAPTLLHATDERLWSYDWSPDGRTVVYAAGRPQDLFLAAVTGPTLTVSPGPTVAAEPVWSRDGAAIAFAGDCNEFTCQFLRANPDGTDRRPLLTGPAAALTRGQDLAWSPAGEQVAFVALDPANGGLVCQVYWVDLTSMELRQLTDNAQECVSVVYSSLSFSPDGRWVSLVQRNAEDAAAPGEIVLLPVDGTNAVTLPASPTVDPSDVVWLPRGDWLVFSGRVPEGDTFQTDLFAIQRDGTRLTRLTETPDHSEYAPAWRRAPAP